MMRATIASKSARDMLGSKVGTGRSGRGSARGTGPARRSRALAIVASASA